MSVLRPPVGLAFYYDNNYLFHCGDGVVMISLKLLEEVLWREWKRITGSGRAYRIERDTCGLPWPEEPHVSPSSVVSSQALNPALDLQALLGQKSHMSRRKMRKSVENSLFGARVSSL
jgi:hypothetical protein